MAISITLLIPWTIEINLKTWSERNNSRATWHKFVPFLHPVNNNRFPFFWHQMASERVQTILYHLLSTPGERFRTILVFNVFSTRWRHGWISGACILVHPTTAFDIVTYDFRFSWRCVYLICLYGMSQSKYRQASLTFRPYFRLYSKQVLIPVDRWCCPEESQSYTNDFLDVCLFFEWRHQPKFGLALSIVGSKVETSKLLFRIPSVGSYILWAHTLTVMGLVSQKSFTQNGLEFSDFLFKQK